MRLTVAFTYNHKFVFRNSHSFLYKAVRAMQRAGSIFAMHIQTDNLYICSKIQTFC
jgi:hypothetical protein